MRECAIGARRIAATISGTLLLLVAFHNASAQESRPVPRGIRDAYKSEIQGENNIPPPLKPQRKVDAQAMQHDAEELANLAQSVPTQVNQATKGLLARDLNDRLKRIEKLSKKIRGQLNQRVSPEFTVQPFDRTKLESP